ncbi:MAG: DUF5615 family PIN-like protein [Deltaproteobacteria bacterium]|nr:DUF5615 family PIN-like protein [Deltaproteobacteria bacterium]
MRFLANENVPLVAVEGLREAGHDVGWIRTDSPGIDDGAVLARAMLESRILLTFDRDFGSLVFVRGQRASHGIILFRVVSSTPENLANLVVVTLESRTDWEGHFTVVEPGPIRMRRLPPG